MGEAKQPRSAGKMKIGPSVQDSQSISFTTSGGLTQERELPPETPSQRSASFTPKMTGITVRS